MRIRLVLRAALGGCLAVGACSGPHGSPAASPRTVAVYGPHSADSRADRLRVTKARFIDYDAHSPVRLRDINRRDKCTVMPVPGGVLRAYRTTECWVTVWDRERRNNLLLLGSEPSGDGRIATLLVGTANGTLRARQLPIQDRHPYFARVTRHFATLKFRGSDDHVCYSIDHRRFQPDCRWRWREDPAGCRNPRLPGEGNAPSCSALGRTLRLRHSSE